MVKVVVSPYGWYIVAEAIMFPRVNREFIATARAMGANVSRTDLSPEFPEKRMAKVWGKYVYGDVNVCIRLPDWMIRAFYTVRVDEFDKNGNIAYLYIRDRLKKLMKLYGVVRMDDFDFDCLKPDVYVRIMKDLNRVVRVRRGSEDVLRMMDYLSVASRKNVVCVKVYDWKMKEVIEKYAMSCVNDWYCVRKSVAPKMANELLEVME